MAEQREFRSFREFYPYYLSQHANPVCRNLHVAGVLGALTLGTGMVLTGNWPGLLLMPVVGYACSWTGHFVFEKNRPATFGYPLYSLLGDVVMTAETIGGWLGWRRASGTTPV